MTPQQAEAELFWPLLDLLSIQVAVTYCVRIKYSIAHMYDSGEVSYPEALEVEMDDS